MGEADFYKRDLKRMEAEKDVKGLINSLNYAGNWEARAEAAEALGRIGGRRAIEALSRAQKDDEDMLVRLRAREALEEIKKRAPNTSTQTLEYDSHVLLKSLTNLKSVIDKVSVGSLIKALDDYDAYVQEIAARALGEIGDRRAVEPLILALYDEAWEVRWSAAEALGDIGDKRAVEPLTGALNDIDTNVRRAVKEALRRIEEKQES
jgi:HEAT repeat protein